MVKRKKGFVLVETIIVTSILLVSLMVVYTNFTTATSKEKTKLRYDDIADIYKLYYLKDYIENNTTKGIKNDDPTPIPLNYLGTRDYNNTLNSPTDDNYVYGLSGYTTVSNCPIPLNR